MPVQSPLSVNSQLANAFLSLSNRVKRVLYGIGLTS